MNISDTSFNLQAGSAQQRPADSIDTARREQSAGSGSKADADDNAIAPEELLSEIKALTKDGIYSVRFEKNDDAATTVIKIVDKNTDEIVRQVPVDEVLSMKQSLSELRGNIIDTVR